MADLDDVVSELGSVYSAAASGESLLREILQILKRIDRRLDDIEKKRH